MKTTLCKITPLLALTTFAFGQDQPNPTLRPPVEITLVAAPDRATTGSDGTFSIAIKKCSLPLAVEQVQGMVEESGQTRMNLLLNVPNADALKVPDLTLRKVQGPDALALIATAVGCELKPILRVGEATGQTVIGWELRPAARENRFTNNALRASVPAGGIGSSGGVAPGSSVPFASSLSAPVPSAGGGGSPGFLSVTPAPEGGGGVWAAPMKVQLQNTQFPGQVYETPLAPAPTGTGLYAVSPGGDVLIARPVNERYTRVYPLGTVTSYVKFPEVEQSLRSLFSTDGIPESEVKLSLHEKTNILVVNGTDRAHALIGQAVTALGKDASVRDAREGATRRQELEVRLEQMYRELQDRQAQNSELRKAMQETESQRMKAETELKLLKAPSSK